MAREAISSINNNNLYNGTQINTFKNKKFITLQIKIYYSFQ